ncbi:MAG TPA: hypothetical protein VE891_09910 [Allosphingosinicella sp.]|nr:hypothetical protein [Allosphingosinicella sp.]
MPKAYLLVAAAALSLCSSAAIACRAHIPAERHLDSAYRAGTISAVALVRTTGSAYIRAAFGDAHPWRASAEVKRPLRGSYRGRRVNFDGWWGSAACDDGRPRPAAGELWVVYFRKLARGNQAVWRSYPAATAYAADPRLRGGGR